MNPIKRDWTFQAINWNIMKTIKSDWTLQVINWSMMNHIESDWTFQAINWSIMKTIKSAWTFHTINWNMIMTRKSDHPLEHEQDHPGHTLHREQDYTVSLSIPLALHLNKEQDHGDSEPSLRQSMSFTVLVGL